MGRSNETFGKKEVRSKQEKNRKEKEKRRQIKKEKGKQSLDDMIAWVDENGMITSTPPDLSKREEVDASTILIGIPKKELRGEPVARNGIITKFDTSRGFGFIQESDSNLSIFMHVNDCQEPVKNGDRVEFETEKGNKGLKAVNVRLKKKEMN